MKGESLMKVNPRYLSFYYQDLTELPNISLDQKTTALLIIDLQNEFCRDDIGEAKELKTIGGWDRWIPHYKRLNEIVIPNTKRLLDYFRENKMYVTYGRIASLLSNGEDRSPVQKTEGWNGLLLPVNDYRTQIVEPLMPINDEIVVNKITDSVCNSTNYVFLLKNMGIETIIVTGIVTDQCVASTVRDLADAGFKIIVVEDCCASADMDSHHAELKIMNVIYCNVLLCDETLEVLKENSKSPPLRLHHNNE